MVVVAASAPAAGQLGVSLGPAARQDETHPTYRAAVLTIDNSDGSVGRVIRAAAVRCADGGATFLYPLAVAPKTKQTLNVSLPALSVRQEVDVRLLAGESADAPVLASRRLVVTWPEEVISSMQARIVDLAAYQAWEREHPMPTWPATLKRNVFLLLVLAAVAAAATLLVRRPLLRIIGIAVIVAAAVAVLVVPLSRVEEVSAGDFRFERLAATRPAAERMLAVTCLRTADWRHPDAGLIPLYRSREEMAADTMVVRADGGISVTLAPNSVRLFRHR